MPGRDLTTGFCGRTDELSRLTHAFSGVRAGAIAIVHGEAGIGKTRLVAQFAAGLGAEAAGALWGASAEGGIARPYEPWAQIVAEVTRRLGSERLLAELGDEARWLQPLLESPTSRPALETPPVPPPIIQVRMAEVLSRLLVALDPPLLVLDDMQWATSESLALLTGVARDATSLRLVIIFRGRALDLVHPLATSLAEIARTRECEYLNVDGFSRAEAAEVLQSTADRSLTAEQIDALYAQTAGNAFYLTELGRYLRTTNELTTAGRALPESIRAAVGLRVARLTAEARRVLQMASVFTAGFAFGELQAMTELGEDALLDCLEQALADELIRDAGAERYGFAHALVRRALYEQLSPSRKIRLHRRLAETIERLNLSNPAPAAAELVRQFHASAAIPGAERGARYALIAADRARSLGAPLDAAAILILGLDLVDGDEHGRLLGRLAIARAESEQFEDALVDLKQAMDILQAAGAPPEEVAELVHAVGETAWVHPSSSRAAVPLIHRAIDALGHRRDVAWARLKLVERPVTQLTFGPITTFEWAPLDADAVRILRAGSSEADFAMTLNGWMPGFGSELDELTTRVADWADPTARMYALISLVGYLALLDPAPAATEADRLSHELIGLATEFGLVAHRSVAHALRGALLASRGQAAEAAEQFGAAHERPVGDVPARSSRALTIFLETLAFGAPDGDWDATAETMWALARQPEQFAGWLNLGCAAVAARAHAIAGRPAQARSILEDLLPALVDVDPVRSTATNALGLITAAVWELRDADLARLLLPTAVAVQQADPRAFFTTSPRLTLARLSALTGHRDAALEHVAVARQEFDRAGRSVLRAVTDRDEAAIRLEGGLGGGRERLESARQLSESLGALDWPFRAGRGLARATLPDGLTAREAEILRLVAARWTNREIATQLVISVHTVERHVQNAYRKIGVGTRDQAGRYVVDVGL